ncbi:hypothetical protein HAX54_034745 [Datura stramonium]|uniref:Replication protein A 70 kDa DNA-binding subunit B/D first OB fold domain-containing protein n=1 Tax=Datura stramonium TaxID=4076 RepID=A0ABS8RLQ6_DATST|nr:hypothetical protein [Datura stramonium]
MAYFLLTELNTNRDDWIVRVRVCRLWEFINFKRSRDLISLDMILIDKKGTLIHAVIWKNQANRFHDKLDEGFVIIIRNFKATNSTGEYRTVSFLRSMFNAKILQRYGANNIPLHVEDVVGCLCGIGEIESIGSKWKKPDIQILTNYFADTSIGVQTIESSNAKNIPIEEEMFQNRMNITELLDCVWNANIQGKTKVEDIIVTNEQKMGGFTNTKEHACAFLDNSDDPEQENSVNKSCQRRSPAKKKRLENQSNNCATYKGQRGRRFTW